MLATSPLSHSLPSYVDERRRTRRTPVNRSARLLARDVDGFVLDVSRTGARIVLWATGNFAGGTVLLSIHGDSTPRLAVVQWARTLPDGSILGVEFLEELETRAELDLDIVVTFDGDYEFDDDAAPLPAPDTQIRAVPVCAVQDVPGATPTLEEGSVVVVSCIRLLA